MPRSTRFALLLSCGLGDDRKTNQGAYFCADGNRVGAASNVIEAMRKQVLDRREMKKSTKLRVYNAMALPTMLCRYETWTMHR